MIAKRATRAPTEPHAGGESLRAAAADSAAVVVVSRGDAPSAIARRIVSVDRLLQINLAVLIPLGAFLLGMGERDFTLSAVMLVATVASIYLVDRRQWLRLGRLAANLAALALTVYSMVRFFTAATEEQLPVIANLLVYLQLVLLLQAKNDRVGWQLLVLSGLQVVVATALNLSILFGLLMMVYVLVALATLGLLFIETEARRLQSTAAGKRSDCAPAPDLHSPRWPLRREIQVTAVLPSDLKQQLLGRGILGRTALMGLGTMVVAGICFFLLPRFGKVLLDPLGKQAMVGYSPGVTLGDLGPLLENPELVMRVELRDAQTDEPVVLSRAPLLRGSPLVEYHQGKWRYPAMEREQLGGLPRQPSGKRLVLEHITLEPQQDATLFGVYPPFHAGGVAGRRVRYDYGRGQLSVNSRSAGAGEIEYDLLTTGIAKDAQQRVIARSELPEASLGPMASLAPNKRFEALLNGGVAKALSQAPSMAADLRADLQMPDESPAWTAWRKGDDETPADAAEVNDKAAPLDKLDGLRTAAARRLKVRSVDRNNPYAVAKSLEGMLSEPPFEYTLDRPPVTPGIDPIEDFVTRNPRGHCEYFASALALMLRSQGVPAHVVIGFNGGDYISTGGFYTVRQLNAHAWVEAFVDPEHTDQIPVDQRPEGFDGRTGAWLVLDPTPLVEFQENTYLGTWRSKIAGASNYLQIMWSTYVVGLNAERQQRAFFQPLADLGQALKRAASSPAQSIAGVATQFWHWIFGDEHGQRPALDGQIALGLLLSLVAAFVAYRLLRIVMRRLFSGLFGRGSGAVGKPNSIEFYRRLEAILRQHGMRKRAGQTQREFADAVGGRLAPSAGREIADLPRRLVEAFYHVRFGGKALDSAEQRAVEQGLDQLSQALRRRVNGRK